MCTGIINMKRAIKGPQYQVKYQAEHKQHSEIEPSVYDQMLECSMLNIHPKTFNRALPFPPTCQSISAVCSNKQLKTHDLDFISLEVQNRF